MRRDRFAKVVSVFICIVAACGSNVGVSEGDYEALSTTTINNVVVLPSVGLSSVGTVPWQGTGPDWSRVSFQPSCANFTVINRGDRAVPIRVLPDRRLRTIEPNPLGVGWILVSATSAAAGGTIRVAACVNTVAIGTYSEQLQREHEYINWLRIGAVTRRISFRMREADDRPKKPEMTVQVANDRPGQTNAGFATIGRDEGDWVAFHPACVQYKVRNLGSQSVTVEVQTNKDWILSPGKDVEVPAYGDAKLDICIHAVFAGRLQSGSHSARVMLIGHDEYGQSSSPHALTVRATIQPTLEQRKSDENDAIDTTVDPVRLEEITVVTGTKLDDALVDYPGRTCVAQDGTFRLGPHPWAERVWRLRNSWISSTAVFDFPQVNREKVLKVRFAAKLVQEACGTRCTECDRVPRFHVFGQELDASGNIITTALIARQIPLTTTMARFEFETTPATRRIVLARGGDAAQRGQVAVQDIELVVANAEHEILGDCLVGDTVSLIPCAQKPDEGTHVEFVDQAVLSSFAGNKLEDKQAGFPGRTCTGADGTIRLGPSPWAEQVLQLLNMWVTSAVVYDFPAVSDAVEGKLRFQARVTDEACGIRCTECNRIPKFHVFAQELNEDDALVNTVLLTPAVTLTPTFTDYEFEVGAATRRIVLARGGDASQRGQVAIRNVQLVTANKPSTTSPGWPDGRAPARGAPIMMLAVERSDASSEILVALKPDEKRKYAVQSGENADDLVQIVGFDDPDVQIPFPWSLLLPPAHAGGRMKLLQIASNVGTKVIEQPQALWSFDLFEAIVWQAAMEADGVPVMRAATLIHCSSGVRAGGTGTEDEPMSCNDAVGIATVISKEIVVVELGRSGRYPEVASVEVVCGVNIVAQAAGSQIDSEDACGSSSSSASVDKVAPSDRIAVAIKAWQFLEALWSMTPRAKVLAKRMAGVAEELTRDAEATVARLEAGDSKLRSWMEVAMREVSEANQLLDVLYGFSPENDWRIERIGQWSHRELVDGLKNAIYLFFGRFQRQANASKSVDDLASAPKQIQREEFNAMLEKLDERFSETVVAEYLASIRGDNWRELWLQGQLRDHPLVVSRLMRLVRSLELYQAEMIHNAKENLQLSEGLRQLTRELQILNQAVDRIHEHETPSLAPVDEMQEAAWMSVLGEEARRLLDRVPEEIPSSLDGVVRVYIPIEFRWEAMLAERSLEELQSAFKDPQNTVTGLLAMQDHNELIQLTEGIWQKGMNCNYCAFAMFQRGTLGWNDPVRSLSLSERDKLETIPLVDIFGEENFHQISEREVKDALAEGGPKKAHGAIGFVKRSSNGLNSKGHAEFVVHYYGVDYVLNAEYQDTSLPHPQVDQFRDLDRQLWFYKSERRLRELHGGYCVAAVQSDGPTGNAVLDEHGLVVDDGVIQLGILFPPADEIMKDIDRIEDLITLRCGGSGPNDSANVIVVNGGREHHVRYSYMNALIREAKAGRWNLRITYRVVQSNKEYQLIVKKE